MSRRSKQGVGGVVSAALEDRTEEVHGAEMIRGSGSPNCSPDDPPFTVHQESQEQSRSEARRPYALPFGPLVAPYPRLVLAEGCPD